MFAVKETSLLWVGCIPLYLEISHPTLSVDSGKHDVTLVRGTQVILLYHTPYDFF